MKVMTLDSQASLTPSEDTRARALKALRSKGYRALSEVERMLGWDKVYGITNYILAKKLGVTENQIKYMLFAKEYREEAKSRRVANNYSKVIEFANYHSTEQDFSISYPKEWVVTADEQYQEEYVLFSNGDNEFPKIELGLFQVCHPNENDEYCAMAEVVKLKFVSPISALELFKLDKPPHEAG